MRVTKEQAINFFKTVPTDYFTNVSISIEENAGYPKCVLTMSTDDIRISMDIYTGDTTMDVCGHTSYFSHGTWYTFDRRGISDSFYLLGFQSEKWDVVLTILEEIERAENAIKKGLENGPCIELFYGISVTQKRLDKASSDLHNFKKVTFVPGGMGTGYAVSRARERWSTSVSANVQKLLKCSFPLYATTIDCD